jgi:hypothetical protein
MPRSIVLFFFTSLFLFSCHKAEKDLNFHYTYFPLDKGHYVTYNVLQVEHDFVAHPIPDTFKYQLKVKIGDEVLDNLGKSAKEYFRYLRANSSVAWNATDLWTVVLDSDRLELTEENQRKIKLIFIPTSKKSWNSNVYIPLPEQNCTYSNIHKPFTNQFLVFDSTLVVNQEKNTNFIQHKLKFEIYAKKVGLVKLYYKDLEINNFDTLNIKKGTELYYDATGFGIE